jgi:hypothetical protein
VGRLDGDRRSDLADGTPEEAEAVMATVETATVRIDGDPGVCESCGSVDCWREAEGDEVTDLSHWDRWCRSCGSRQFVAVCFGEPTVVEVELVIEEHPDGSMTLSFGS